MQTEVKIIAYSRCAITNKEIITYELTYPRMIHGELMTHRLFSRNAASSRAIPVAKMVALVEEQTAYPSQWGKNQAGMQADGEVSPATQGSAKYLWEKARDNACKTARDMEKLGLHKQVINRVLEPFQMMKTIVTATELDNWFWLRNHTDADPTIHELASLMLKEKQTHKPVVLQPGEWHMPYYSGGYWKIGFEDSLQDALAISASCCAQVSYRVLDDSLEKAKMIFAKLIESKPCHSSPAEHQATPVTFSGIHAMQGIQSHWPEGITHTDKQGSFWSGNFKGWIQHRQLIPNNVCTSYEENENE
jgi:thymidylate synthase ThyX